MSSVPGAAELSPPPIPLPLEALSPPAAEAPGLWQSMVDRAKRLGAAAVAIVTLAGTLSTPVERPQPNAYETLDERRWPTLPKSPTEICPPTKPESIILADRLLAGGEDPQFTEIRRHESSWGALRNEHSDKDSYLKIRKIFKHQLAADLGLRVFDVPDQKLLEADLQREASPGPRAQKPEMPFDAYFTRTKKFLAQYGVELQVGKPGEKYPWHNTGLTQSQLERTATKQSLYNLMLFFSELPKEFVDFIGLSKIVLTATEDNVPEGEAIAAGSAEMKPEPNRTMWLNVGGGSLDASTIAHESGHMMDAAVCGSPGAGNDPEFLALNHGETYDVKNRSVNVDTREFNQSWDLINGMNKAYKAGDFELEKRLRQALAELRAQITFVSLAGGMIEDKADTGGQIPLAVNTRPRALDEDTPHIENKFLLLFARIAQYDRPLAIFLARYGRYDSRTVGKNPLVRAAMIDVKVR